MMQVFLFESLNVKMNKNEICTYNQSIFKKNKYFTTVLFQRKRRLYDTFFRTKINQLYTNFDYRPIMTKKTFKKH